MKNDSLQVLEAAVIDSAKAKGIPIFTADDLSGLFAYDESDRNLTITVYWEAGKPWEDFLNVALGMKARGLYISAIRFNWNRLIDEINSNFENDPEEIGQRTKAAEAFREYNGRVEQLILAFYFDGVWHAYQETTDWLPKYLELKGEADEDEDEQEEELDASEVNKWAEKLAFNEKFGSCKGKVERGYLLEEISGKEFERLQINESEIIDRANRIYFSRVKPEEERRLKQKIQELHNKGHKVSEIVSKLGISRDRVRKLLGD